MTAPTYQAPGGVAGYCGRCGTPFGPGAGQFCRTCGNRVRSQPAVATNYTYPAVPTSSVPAAQHKLGHKGFVVVAFASLFVLVVIITAVAVGNKPTTSLCHFSCGPNVGPRLLSSTNYANSQFGYRIEYDPPFSIESKNAGGVEFGANFGFIVFEATSGTNVSGAIQSAISGLNTNTIQDLQQQTSTLPGAQVGFVQGEGVAYDANFIPSGGGSSVPVVVMAMAATQGNMTISVLAVGAKEANSAAQLPYGMINGGLFDFEVSNTIWPGQA
jgi:hypothetical protein